MRCSRGCSHCRKSQDGAGLKAMWVGDCFEDLSEVPGPVHLAIGVFDGLHRGHIAVIRRALEASRASGGTTALLTFHPHPLAVLRPEGGPGALTGARQRLGLLRAVGVHHVVVLPFTTSLARLSGEEFVQKLVESCRPLLHICVGHEWVFGRDRSGSIELLRKLGTVYGFNVDAIDPVRAGGRIISSTAIRAAVRSGQLADAQAMLGRPYALFGNVRQGRGAARQLGFPTANVAVENEVLPPDGVYSVRAVVDGNLREGIANLGVRPTFMKGSQREFEVHFFDFEGNLYGQDLEVELMGFVRPEQKFESLGALRNQIAADVDAVKALLQRRDVCQHFPGTQRGGDGD